ncbi:NAD(P)/FAD-dependent oxidoreductase [Thermogemmatispora tikiterensis]|uniref:Pyridine nucleotide-disulfide oxidoreductase n=1 Tax=Thermogemmatispora tikiterensis TaxID=1825093 RepID=A0A328VEH0_9CHLR|nr:FAD-dependent oxidoreductase [Thermogemmatispora tikiterensis]RAQ94160.1 hypothetical protein A4R35_01355 [Thermogemmatispora tikiterensis]
MKQRFLIIGAGQAGVSAAVTLRHEGFDGEIMLIGAESHLPYERPPLSKDYLLGQKPIDDLFIHNSRFYVENHIQTLLGVKAVRVNPYEKVVELARANCVRPTIAYDKLLIATGVRNRKLRVPGATLEGIYYLRTIEEADAIRQACRSGQRAVLVGMGFIGCEVAASLRQSGIEVVAIEAYKTPLYRVVGEKIGKVFEEIHREHGVRFLFEETIVAFEASQRVQCVVTSSGRRIDCDFVIIGVGVEPVTELVEGSEVQIENGIVVNQYCQTQVPDIYAAGDVANHFHPVVGKKMRVEHWQNAISQGRAAALNMLGRREPYQEVHWFWSDQYKYNVQYAGFPCAWDQLVVRGKLNEHKFTAFYMQEGKVMAVISINRGKDILRTIPLIRAQIPVDPLKLQDEATDLRSLQPRAVHLRRSLNHGGSFSELPSASETEKGQLQP